MPEEVKLLVLRKRKEILLKIKDYINDFLNPSKTNFFDPSRDTGLNISEEEYENALKISDDNDFQLHFREAINSCFANNYFDIGLLAWEADIDIQPVFDYCKVVTYMCSYLSKQEDECSQAMKQAVKNLWKEVQDLINK